VTMQMKPNQKWVSEWIQPIDSLFFSQTMVCVAIMSVCTVFIEWLTRSLFVAVHRRK
jgi:hypothetical protein